MLRTSPRAGGFTLVEVLTVVLVTGIMGLGLGEVLIQGTRIQRQTSNSRLALYHLQQAGHSFTRDVREMGSRSSITAFGSKTFAFSRRDGGSVTYASSGSELLRNGEPACQYLSDWGISFWDAEGDAALNAADIRLVEIDLAVNISGESYSAVYAAFPRSIAE